MQIIVKRFCLSHGGEIYKAGDVAEIADPQMAKRLVAQSGGDLEIYHGDELADVEDASDEDADIDNEDGSTSDAVSDSDTEDDTGGIPAVDPAAAVQTESESPKGKGKGRKK